MDSYPSWKDWTWWGPSRKKMLRLPGRHRNINIMRMPISRNIRPAAACGEEAAVGRWDGGSGSPVSLVGALWMHQLHWRRTQDKILLLDWMVTALEEWLADTWAWQVEDMWQVEDLAYEELVDGVFRAWFVDLVKWHVEDLEWQALLVARAVEVMEEDRQVLDTILDLADAFRLPAAMPPTAALPGPC
ncbi:hypothetical protein Y1Q_0000963 [Alligator mississippiensis]|uniref:Uncharacterized protein n=1 Tax=Alligator mississippiensis TaxID=8496 RepID=A0A151NE09_ALLMI|nr:hypothetical protein Y1Q_0000963 [Alligator mississippiensis]